MQLRLECYGHERDAAVAALESAFRVKSVSKAYPNTRQTGVAGAPCENRYYVTLDGKDPVRHPDDMRDTLTLDLLRFLAWVSDGLGIDASREVETVRRFYDGCAGFPCNRQTELALACKADICGRLLGPAGKRGGEGGGRDA